MNKIDFTYIDREFDKKFTIKNITGLEWRGATPSNDGMPNYDWVRPYSVKSFLHSSIAEAYKQGKRDGIKSFPMHFTRRSWQEFLHKYNIKL